MVQDQLTKIVQHRNHEQVEKVPPAPRPSIAEPETAEPPKQVCSILREKEKEKVL